MDLPAQSGRCHEPVDGSLEVQSDKPSLVRCSPSAAWVWTPTASATSLAA
jgi:hypothetical protein